MTERTQKAPYPLRMPDELREQLEAASARGSRSLNAEIVTRLQDTFNKTGARGFIHGPEMTGLNFDLEQAQAQSASLAAALDNANERLSTAEALIGILALHLRHVSELLPEHPSEAVRLAASARDVANLAAHGRVIAVVDELESYLHGSLKSVTSPASVKLLNILRKQAEESGQPHEHGMDSASSSKPSSYADYAMAVLESGVEPQRAADGTIIPTEKTGAVKRHSQAPKKKK